MTFEERLEHLISAGFQIIYIPTGERSRCELSLKGVADKLKLEFKTWDAIDGFSGETAENARKDPIEALDSLNYKLNSKDKDPWNKKDIMFVMRNLHVFIEDATCRQALQNLYFDKKLNGNEFCRPIVILASAMQIHSEISQCVTLAPFQLPTEKELTKVFDDVAEDVEETPDNPGANVKFDEEMRGRAVRAMRGLTAVEARNILSYSLRVNRGYNPELIDTLENQKAVNIQKSEILTYIPKEKIASMDDVGGYAALKEFIAKRKKAYTVKAQEINMDIPKGIVLLGQPGTGKSLVGKVTARELGLPLVLINMASVFGSLVGESERRIKTALDTIDALDGAVALIDEAEKALGGTSESTGDSGVGRRVFGTILTWLTEKTSRTFVIMTMNRTRGVPAEFLRKGRVDAVFFTDLPTAEERDEILRIHCRKRNIDLTKFSAAEFEELVKTTDQFVGSELEQVVCDARFESFDVRGDGQPTIDEFLMVASVMKPMAITDQEAIKEIRALGEGKAIPVSGISSTAQVTDKKKFKINV